MDGDGRQLAHGVAVQPQLGAGQRQELVEEDVLAPDGQAGQHGAHGDLAAAQRRHASGRQGGPGQLADELGVEVQVGGEARPTHRRGTGRR